MSRPLQAAESDRAFTVETYIDWVGAGYTLKLRIRPPGGGAIYQLGLTTVLGQTTQAQLITDATTFPNPGRYVAQVFAFSGAVEKLKSRRFSFLVNPNIPAS